MEYKNPQKAIRDHVKEKYRYEIGKNIGVNVSFTLSSNQKNTIFICEAGLYQLIMNSKKKEAEAVGHLLADKLKAEVAQVLGHTVLLYREANPPKEATRCLEESSQIL